MALRKPNLSLDDARRLARIRSGMTTPPKRDDLQSEASAEKSTQTQTLEAAPMSPTAPQARYINFGDREEIEPKVQVFLSAPIPARGVSQTFDLLSERHRPAKALQMILRRALDDYEVNLTEGLALNPAPGYLTQDPFEFVSTSRMMPQKLVDIAVDQFDPLGLESSRAIGRMLATSALTLFFSSENIIKRSDIKKASLKS